MILGVEQTDTDTLYKKTKRVETLIKYKHLFCEISIPPPHTQDPTEIANRKKMIGFVVDLCNHLKKSKTYSYFGKINSYWSSQTINESKKILETPNNDMYNQLYNIIQNSITPQKLHVIKVKELIYDFNKKDIDLDQTALFDFNIGADAKISYRMLTDNETAIHNRIELTPIHVTILIENMDIFHYLYLKGADKEKPTVCKFPPDPNSVPNYEFHGLSTFLFASKILIYKIKSQVDTRIYFDIVDNVIDTGGNFIAKDYYGNNILHIAVIHKTIGFLHYLFNHKFRISIFNNFIHKNKNGECPLNFAVKYGDLHIIRVLLNEIYNFTLYYPNTMSDSFDVMEKINTGPDSGTNTSMLQSSNTQTELYKYKSSSMIAIQKNDIQCVLYLFLFFILLYNRLLEESKKPEYVKKTEGRVYIPLAMCSNMTKGEIQYHKNRCKENLVLLLDYILTPPVGEIIVEKDETTQQITIKMNIIRQTAKNFLDRFKETHLECINTCFSREYKYELRKECIICLQLETEDNPILSEFHVNQGPCNPEICRSCYSTIERNPIRNFFRCPICRQHIKPINQVNTENLNVEKVDTEVPPKDKMIEVILNCFLQNLTSDQRKCDLVSCFNTDQFIQVIHQMGLQMGGHKNGGRRETRRIRKRVTKRMKRAPKRITKHRM